MPNLTTNPLDFPSVELRRTHELPDCSGIYFAVQVNKFLYIGQSINIRKRWRNHHRYYQLSQIPDVRIHWLASDGRPLLEQEREWIQKYNPVLNSDPVIERERRERQKRPVPWSVVVIRCFAIFIIPPIISFCIWAAYGIEFPEIMNYGFFVSLALCCLQMAGHMSSHTRADAKVKP